MPSEPTIPGGHVTEHVLKVDPPYFESLADGSKTFDVRRNDRAFQRGDTLVLLDTERCSCGRECQAFEATPDRVLRRRVTYVYSGDPRFGGGGVQPGFVVLGLGPIEMAR